MDRLVRCPSLVVPLIALCTFGCVATRPADESQDALDAGVNEAYRLFSEAWAALDAEAAAALWTADAMFIPPDADADIIRGRDQIEAIYASVFAGARDVEASTSISFRIVDRTIQGDVAADVGYAQSVRHVDGETPVRYTSKFAIVLKREADDTWRFHVDSFSDAPDAAFVNAASGLRVGE